MSAYAVLGTLWGIIFWVFLGKMAPRFGYLTMHRAIGNDPPGLTPEGDFSVFWTAGLLARWHDYAEIYQPQRFVVWGAKLFFPGAQIQTFFYPPQMLLPNMLISYLPFEIGFFVWTLVGIVVAVLLLRWVRLPWGVIVLGLLSPAALWSIEAGQLGVAGGALLVAGLCASVDRRGRAGAVLGLLVCKPQLGILVPVALCGQRNGRALIGFALMCGVLSAIVFIVCGPTIWSLYVSEGRAQSAQVLGATFNPYTAAGGGVSVFWMLRSLHMGLAASYAGQALSTILAVAMTGWVWTRDEMSLTDRVALTVFLSLLATPYGYWYDMVGYSVMLLALAERRRWRIGMLDVLFVLWPGLCQIVSQKTGVLLTPVVVMLLVARTWSRAGLPVPYLPVRVPVLPRA
jgi:hypothetical protein